MLPSQLPLCVAPLLPLRISIPRSFLALLSYAPKGSTVSLAKTCASPDSISPGIAPEISYRPLVLFGCISLDFVFHCHVKNRNYFQAGGISRLIDLRSSNPFLGHNQIANLYIVTPPTPTRQSSRSAASLCLTQNLRGLHQSLAPHRPRGRARSQTRRSVRPKSWSSTPPSNPSENCRL